MPKIQALDTLSAGDVFRKQWAEVGADYAWGVLLFLQGLRRNEISTMEILTTQTYKHSTPGEKDALKFVAAQSEQLSAVTSEDTRMLVERDQWLMRFAAGDNLGHQDLVKEIERIPAAVERARRFDASLFGTTFESPRGLFSWIWKRQ